MTETHTFDTDEWRNRFPSRKTKNNTQKWCKWWSIQGSLDLHVSNNTVREKLFYITPLNINWVLDSNWSNLNNAKGGSFIKGCVLITFKNLTQIKTSEIDLQKCFLIWFIVKRQTSLISIDENGKSPSQQCSRRKNAD